MNLDRFILGWSLISDTSTCLHKKPALRNPGLRGRKTWETQVSISETQETFSIQNEIYVDFLGIWYKNHQIWPKIKKFLRSLDRSAVSYKKN